jgi:uncharacterized membrane protein
MATRWFALIIGVVYLLVGIAGFIPALGDDRTSPDLVVDSHYRDLLGLFPINILHNIVHLLIGLAGIAAYRTYGSARAYSRGLAILYAILAVMGLIPVLETTFDLIPLFSHDIWLHAATALVAAYFGWVARPEVDDEPLRTEPYGTVR